jgi:DNA-binding NtrC family response regulator
MIRLFHQAERMAAGDLCVFIFGARGTGKTALAKAIHEASPRCGAPFVAIDVLAHAPERISAELFGANPEGGDRPGRPGFLEEADGGTLFIDNIERLPIEAQLRLNRVIQYKEFYREFSPRIHKIDVRVIAASLHDLTEEEYQKSFSRDLLYRLMVNSLHLPPLRQRKKDIEIFANDILQQEARRIGRKLSGFTKELMDLLLDYDFPGNVEELTDIVATSVINAEGDLIGIEALPPHLRDTITSGRRSLMGFHPRKLKDVVRDHVDKTVRYLNGDRSKAAETLGIEEVEIERILESD